MHFQAVCRPTEYATEYATGVVYIIVVLLIALLGVELEAEQIEIGKGELESILLDIIPDVPLGRMLGYVCSENFFYMHFITTVGIIVW